MSLKNLNVTTKIPRLLKNKLNNFRINKIYKSFEKSLNIKEDFVVAVSGGPDSLALAFLSKIYSLINNVKSKYFIIDHKLRVDSTKEAIKVKKILKKYSIPTSSNCINFINENYTWRIFFTLLKHVSYS